MMIVPKAFGDQTAAMYRRNVKRRAYEQGIIQVEHGLLTPLVFSATRGMGQAVTVAYKEWLLS